MIYRVDIYIFTHMCPPRVYTRFCYSYPFVRNGDTLWNRARAQLTNKAAPKRKKASFRQKKSAQAVSTNTDPTPKGQRQNDGKNKKTLPSKTKGKGGGKKEDERAKGTGLAGKAIPTDRSAKPIGVSPGQNLDSAKSGDGGCTQGVLVKTRAIVVQCWPRTCTMPGRTCIFTLMTSCHCTAVTNSYVSTPNRTGVSCWLGFPGAKRRIFNKGAGIPKIPWGISISARKLQ